MVAILVKHVMQTFAKEHTVSEADCNAISSGTWSKSYFDLMVGDHLTDHQNDYTSS